ncbi:hypothetical protein HID58_067660, partial [Brassica napus]
SFIPQCHIGDTLPTLKTPTAGFVEQRVVPLPHLPSMKIESVTLSETNSYVLNSSLGTSLDKDHCNSMTSNRGLSDYMAAVFCGPKYSSEMECSDHTNGHLMLFQLLKDIQPAQTHSLRILIQS